MISILIVGGFGVLAAGIALRSFAPNSAPLTWSLFKQPEALTEVYFSDHKTLPTSYTPSETYLLTFTVVNKEGRPMSYPFEIVAEGEGKRIVIATGTLAVENGEVKTHSTPVTYSDLGPTAHVTVSLPEQGQSLQYFAKRRES